MTTNALAAALVEDYENLGFGKRLNATEIKSYADETVVALDSTNSRVLEVYVNGDLVTELIYDDPEFSDKLIKIVASALNV